MRVCAGMKSITRMGVVLCSNTIHAQGLEGLDGVVRSEFDKCFDDIETPFIVPLEH